MGNDDGNEINKKRYEDEDEDESQVCVALRGRVGARCAVAEEKRGLSGV